MFTVSLEEARLSKEQLDVIRHRLKTGELTYDEAKLLAKEPFKIVNAYMERRARDFGVKHRSVCFTHFMR